MLPFARYTITVRNPDGATLMQFNVQGSWEAIMQMVAEIPDAEVLMPGDSISMDIVGTDYVEGWNP